MNITSNTIPKVADCGKVDERTTSETSPDAIREYVDILQGGFKEPAFSCACFRPSSEATTFGHFQHSGRLSATFAEIDRTFHERAKLTLQKDCFLRLQTSTEFVSELEKTAEGYSAFSRKLFDSCDNHVSKDFPFKAERFRDICQRAKAQLRHWSAIRQTIFSDPLLRKSVSDLLNDLQIVKQKLQQQGKSAILWIASILSYIIRIAESCQWRLSHEVLQSIFRGVEDYNRLCEFFKDVSTEVESVFSLDEATFSAHAKMRLLRCHITVTPKHELVILPISLNKLLSGVARERSSILARHVHKFLFENEESTRISASNFEWKDFSQASKQSGTQQRNGVVVARNSIPRLKLTPEAPLLSFDSLESAFVSNLIFQLANATTLMLGAEKGTSLQKPLHNEGINELYPLSAKVGAHGILKNHSGSTSPCLNKRVQWLAPLDRETKGRLCLQYMSMVWSYFGLTLFQEMQEPVWKAKQLQHFSFGSMPFWSDVVMFSVVSLLESLHTAEDEARLGVYVVESFLKGELKPKMDSFLLEEGCLPPVGSQSIKFVSQRIHWYASYRSFNSGYSKLLSMSLKDKCISDSECTEEFPLTMTVQAAVALLDPLNSFFEVACWHEPQTNDAAKLARLTLLPSMNQLQSLLAFCLSWFSTKLNRFLSSWSLGPFFLLTHWDLPCLLSSVKKTMKMLQSLCSNVSVGKEWSSLQIQWHEVQDFLGKLEALGKGSWEQLLNCLTKLSTEFFQEAMPKGKSWRKSRHGGVPFQRNSYAQHVVSDILAPVVRSTVQLPSDTRLEILTHAVNTLLTCWGDHILREEIIFSYYGAQQLQLDFNFVKIWIASEESGMSDEIQSSLLSSDVFRNLDGAASLLMLQPRKKKNKESEELDVELESNASAVSSSSVLSSLSGADLDGYDVSVLNDKSIPNSKQWLSLRLRGGKSKKALLPFCLKVQ